MPERLRYEDAREALEGHQRATKRELAARADAPPETLYYLACDDDLEVRSLVAANPASPIHADELLRTDSGVEVREELARKISRMMPDMPRSERTALQQRTVELLEKIAEDEAPRVRAIVAREVARCPTIPKQLATRLARDVEISVCGPILQYSPLLSDEDLVELIATCRIQGAVDAIARREGLSARVSDAVIATLDISAVAQLLTNPSARIRENSLESVIAKAAGIEAWHQPLVMRTELSLRAVRRIATFVSRALIDELAHRNNLDEETSIWLKARARDRIDAEKPAERPALDRNAVTEAFARGDLGDEMVMDAATTGQKTTVVLALSLLSGVDRARIEQVIEAESGRGIAALCWKAGLAMRTALSIQTYIAHVPKNNLVLPRAGIDYPMEPSEMLWHLQYFGIDTEVN
ncbi:MAG: DUF2336 domain-containing protein [Parvibaculum sp.]|uniref:DUF2336 domain-containing protein n=1 Tax=Parvibaculum sp. TaxID=2024848 RepID=UPI002728A6CA|nr:DUF2336 domain-containing protein [Parvibaculum sp.]MDO8839102.1 DUF2336 domain-containing protein [Parvibaculum sp.]